MEKRNLHLQKKVLPILLVLLLSVAGMTKGFAQNYDFSAVCETGQTLYYKITDADYHYVKITIVGYETEVGMVWQVPKPSGDIILPENVLNDGVTYSVTSIGEYAFYDCDNLTSLTVSNSVTSIGSWSFYDCDGLTSFIIGNSVTSIGNYAFYNCSNLTSITFPNSVTSIGSDAFNECGALTSIVLPNSVTSIGIRAFLNTGWYDNQQNGILYLYGCCLGYKGSKPMGILNIANGTRVIADYAFYGCSNLTGSLTIPNSVISIGEYAFHDCTGFTGSLSIPNSVTSIGKEAFFGCSGFTGSLIIPNSVASIGKRVFRGCSGFTGSLTIPNSVTSIGEEAFCLCTGFTGSLTIPNSVSEIGESAFAFTGFTGSLNIPNSVTSIGKRVFRGCSGFTGSLTIPNSVTSIGEEAFSLCSGFTGSLTLPNSVTSIEYQAFSGCSGFTGSLTLPNSLTSIGRYVFSGCGGFTGSLTIPNYVASIGERAFSGCSSLTSLTIGNSVITIGNYAFYNCSSLISMTILPATPPSCGNSVFYNVPRAISVYVPCGTKTIYENSSVWNEFSNYQAFSIDVVASASPIVGGILSGAGSYCINEICTLIATANEDYTFLNWTENGEVVSSNAIYSFTVMGDRTLVANFTPNSLEIVVTANPIEGGTVTGASTYNYGATATLTAMAAENFSFVNWTEAGVEVSTNSTYTFIVTSNRNLVANFTNSSNYWTPNENDYEDNMTFTCILQLDGVEQRTTIYEVGAFCGEECRGSQRANYFPPTDSYIIQMTVFGEVNDVISFRLYDHQQQQELLLTPPTPVAFIANGYGSLFNPYVLNFTSTVQISAEVNPAGAGTIMGTGDYMVGAEVTLTANANPGYQFYNWTLDGNVVSTSVSYQFTVTEAANFVANFRNVHTQALNSGWNWWSSYIELSNIEELNQLENSIGSAGIIIKSRNSGYVEAYLYNGTTNWYGTLNAINNEQMYKICTNAACNATIVGDATTPSNHPINIKNGWNWIGYPCIQSVSVDVAMSTFTPENNDIIKGRNGYTTYYADGNYNLWFGTLNTLEPGRGYMYRSNSTTQKTLVFQTGRGETTMENVTTENNIFQPTDSDFADNMTITAVLELDGEELRSDDYELAAFVGDECRGSVRLMYVEPIDRYVAFLVVFGVPDEAMHFTVTDGTQTELSMEEIAFEADGMVGSLAEPKILCFGTTRVDENELSKVLVYPNPSNGVFNIQGQGIRKIEVFNAFGQAVVSEETSNDHLQIDLSRYADGCYMLRVVTDNGISNRHLIKK